MPKMITVVDVLRKHFRIDLLTLEDRKALDWAVGNVMGRRWLERTGQKAPDADVIKTSGNSRKHKLKVYPVYYESLIEAAYLDQAAEKRIRLRRRRTPLDVPPRNMIAMTCYVEAPPVKRPRVLPLAPAISTRTRTKVRS